MSLQALIGQMKLEKTCAVIRHLHFEDLGTLDGVLAETGYSVRYYDLGVDWLAPIVAQRPSLLVILGGPVGVYDEEAYPFLVDERRIIEARLADNLPTLGICLGAQQIARAMGASVAPARAKEIGFAEISVSDTGMNGPLRHLRDVPVLHWHGDCFDLPESSQNLASTALCSSQAFASGPNILGLQFHAEFDWCAGIERWLVGHAVELSAAGIDPDLLRSEADQYGRDLQIAANKMFREWLDQTI